MKPIHRNPRGTSAVKRTGLARALSKLGYCSRTQAGELIREGKVQLNGNIARSPEAPVRIGIDRIAVAGQRIGAADKIYLMMYKPRGIVTTAADEKGRDTVYSLLPKGMEWIAPVGRLDKASEGLLLLTNDSEWAARITDPATHLDKTYHVQIGALANDEMLERLTRGIETTKGEVLRAKEVRVVRTGEKNCWVEIVLDEGKNRQIRRMFDGLGIAVLRLIRVSIGAIQLGDLAKSMNRPLRHDEKILIDRAVEKSST
ncbi:MAG TPA: pseudouridine synthase [Candidatus Acidoferrum sp.]